MGKNNGISLVSLIILIVVIIILASVTIFTGLNTVDKANFASFTQEISEFSNTLQKDFLKRKNQYIKERKNYTNDQIYYIIASNEEIDPNESTTPAGTIESLGLDIVPNNLLGADYYLITSDKNIEGWNIEKNYYEPKGASGEKHYLTDKGEVFILPGYRVDEDGTIKWYVNEKKYYVSD